MNRPPRSGVPRGQASAYVRVGSTNRRADRELVEELRRFSRGETGDRSRIMDRTEIRSLPVRAIEETIAFVEKHALHGAEIGRLRRKERWDLPPAAVREAVINARNDSYRSGGMTRARQTQTRTGP